MMKSVSNLWHKIKFNYYNVLIQDCLDENMRIKLLDKAAYHKSKLLEAS